MQDLPINTLLGVSRKEKSKFSLGMKQPIHGFSVTVLLKLLAKNFSATELRYINRLFLHLVMTGFRFLPALAEDARFGHKIASVRPKQDPVFIIGHWRSGTTFLHNLLNRTSLFNTTLTYQSLFPDCFLLPMVQRMVKTLEKRGALHSETRPMDDVKLGLYEPCEDELLLFGQSGISPYIRVLFPRKFGKENHYRYPSASTEIDRRLWGQALDRMVKKLTIFDERQLLLKSPTHTARIPQILEYYPQAKFIHIKRDPYVVFASSLILWKRGLALSHLQSVSDHELVEIILETYNSIHEKYIEDRPLIPEGNLVEIRFEELEKKPLAVVKNIFECLDLGKYESVAYKIDAYLRSLGNYKKNRYNLSESVKQIIYKRWKSQILSY